jgi:arginyl-tRNA synthetase
MLLAELDDKYPDYIENPPNMFDLEAFYKNSKKRFDTEEDFKKRAHENVVKLQSGDDRCVKGW